MSNDLVTLEQKSLTALDANIGNDLDGEPLRFRDGKWLQGFDKAFIESGTVMRFAPLSIQDGYMKWIDGKPVDNNMREWTSTQGAILREDLGDLDESAWPNGKDPWAFTLIAAFKDADGTMFKFSTGSTGGVNAIRKLMRAWRRDRDQHPGLVPVVTLGTDSYLHKIHKNTVLVPVFEIMGWESWDENAPARVESPTTQVKNALNDDIPF